MQQQQNLPQIPIETIQMLQQTPPPIIYNRNPLLACRQRKSPQRNRLSLALATSIKEQVKCDSYYNSNYLYTCNGQKNFFTAAFVCYFSYLFFASLDCLEFLFFGV